MDASQSDDTAGSSAQTTPSTPSFAQTMVLHNNNSATTTTSNSSSKLPTTQGDGLDGSRAPSVLSAGSSASTAVSSTGDAYANANAGLGLGLGPYPTAAAAGAVKKRREDIVTQSQHFYELNVPLPPVPGGNGGVARNSDSSSGVGVGLVSGRMHAVSATESLLDNYDDNDDDSSEDGQYEGKPPVPPKDADYDASRRSVRSIRSRASAASTVPADGGSRNSNNHYMPFYHTQPVGQDHVTRERESLSNTYTTYTQSYGPAAGSNPDLIVLDEPSADLFHASPWGIYRDADGGASRNSNASANVNHNNNVFDSTSRISTPPFFQNNSSSASFPGEQFRNSNQFHDESMRRAPSPPLPKLPPGPIDDQQENYQYNNAYYGGQQSGLPPAPAPGPGPGRAKKPLWRRILKMPLLVYFLTFVQVVVFIAQFIRMGVLTGSPIATQPTFNPMIGPSSYVLINMGARFTPCMHAIANVTDDSSLRFPCPNSTTTETNVCSLHELCGMGGGVPTQAEMDAGHTAPHQWWRFITPIFLHAGIVHLGFNMLLQLKLGGELERAIGHTRFFVVYFVSGIGGFLLGGNFTPAGVASTGASGALFGLIALDLLDLLFNWSTYENPKRALAINIAEIVISFVIGLLPGLDNFSHIGGFVMGLLMGTAVLKSPRSLRRRKRDHLRRMSRLAMPEQQPGTQQDTIQKEREGGGPAGAAGYDDVSLTTFRDYSQQGGDGDTQQQHHRHGFRRHGRGGDVEDQRSGNAHDGGLIEMLDSPQGGAGSTLPQDTKNSAQVSRRSPFYDDTEASSFASSSSDNQHQRPPALNPFETASRLSMPLSPTEDPASTGSATTATAANSSSPARARYDPRRMARQRPKSWYTWALVRAACLGLVVAYYIGLIVNFQNGGGHCSWCKYLSCLPVNGWCDIGDIQTAATNSNSGAALGYVALYIVRALLQGS